MAIMSKKHNSINELSKSSIIILLGSGSGMIMQRRPGQGLQVVLCMLLPQLLERYNLLSINFHKIKTVNPKIKYGPSVQTLLRQEKTDNQVLLQLKQVCAQAIHGVIG